MSVQVRFLNKRNIKKFIGCVTVVASLFCASASAFQITGPWVTTNGNGVKNSVVTITEKNGVYTGKVTTIYNVPGNIANCTECKGVNKNKPILNMQIINDLKQDSNEYDDGTILDPKTGKVYKLKITQGDNTDTIKLRGYIGFPLLGKTRIWTRLHENHVS
jgi:uncharacterized protein (DUF2147 family)